MRFLKIDLDKRIFGLDVLRAVAILCVVVEHGTNLLSDASATFQKSIILDGVSIFFVLSGFLIGGILIKLIEEQGRSASILNFWSRRWLRTLPAYFVVLIILVVYNYLYTVNFDLKSTGSYFFFLQNFNSPHPNFFGEAWSLSIEEWFYIIVPILLLLLVKAAKLLARKAVLFTAVFGIIAVITFRYFKYLQVPVNSYDEWDEAFRKQVLTRLDSLMFGIVGAYLAYYHKNIWLKNKLVLMIIGVIILFAEHYCLKTNVFGTELFTCVFSFSVSATGTLFVLPYLSDLKSGKGSLYQLITFISVISYSMYLLNLNFVQVVVLGNIDLGSFNYIAYWAITIIAAALMYRFVEVPFLNLRKKEGS